MSAEARAALIVQKTAALLASAMAKRAQKEPAK